MTKEYFALKVSNYLFQQTNLTVTMTGAISHNLAVKYEYFKLK